MKKSSLALAVLGIMEGVAHAQSSVTLYGSFDAGLRFQNNVGTTAATANASQISLGSFGTYQPNRFGFKGLEDLGNGMNAHFQMEGGLNSSDGASVDPSRLFNRLAFVGLGGGWGSVDLGRNASVAVYTVALYEPMNYKFTDFTPTGAFSPSAGIRYDSDIQYTGAFGPFTVRAEHALGGVAGSPSSGSETAAGLSYTDGFLVLGGAYTLRKMGANSDNLGASPYNVASLAIPAGTFQTNKAWTAGAAYTFGIVRIAAGYSDEQQKNDPLAETRIKNFWLGGGCDVTAYTRVTAAWYHTRTTAPETAATLADVDGKQDLLIVAWAYALSKSTNLYADVDTVKYSGSSAGSATLGGTAANPGTPPFGKGRSTGVSIGMNHLF
jgi:predicted porin